MDVLPLATVLLVLYIVALLIALLSKTPGVVIVAGMFAVLIGMYFMGPYGFWVGLLMAGLGAGLGVVGWQQVTT